MNKQILPGNCSGEVSIPSSKSVVHRMLICAALGEGEVCIRLNGFSKDILATVGCLSALGAVCPKIGKNFSVLLQKAVKGVVVHAIKVLTNYFLLHQKDLRSCPHDLVELSGG